MTVEQNKNSISYCGLICCFCSSDSSCDCRASNHCIAAERLHLKGAFNTVAVTSAGIPAVGNVLIFHVVKICLMKTT